MGLFESSLLSEFEAGQFARFNSVPEDSAEAILQDFELHGRSIAPGKKADDGGKRHIL